MVDRYHPRRDTDYTTQHSSDPDHLGPTPVIQGEVSLFRLGSVAERKFYANKARHIELASGTEYALEEYDRIASEQGDAGRTSYDSVIPYQGMRGMEHGAYRLDEPDKQQTYPNYPGTRL